MSNSMWLDADSNYDLAKTQPIRPIASTKNEGNQSNLDLSEGETAEDVATYPLEVRFGYYKKLLNELIEAKADSLILPLTLTCYADIFRDNTELIKYIRDDQFSRNLFRISLHTQGKRILPSSIDYLANKFKVEIDPIMDELRAYLLDA